MSQKKYQHLLEDKDIRRWYENRRKGGNGIDGEVGFAT